MIAVFLIALFKSFEYFRKINECIEFKIYINERLTEILIARRKKLFEIRSIRKFL